MKSELLVGRNITLHTQGQEQQAELDTAPSTAATHSSHEPPQCCICHLLLPLCGALLLVLTLALPSRS